MEWSYPALPKTSTIKLSASTKSNKVILKLEPKINCVPFPLGGKESLKKEPRKYAFPNLDNIHQSLLFPFHLSLTNMYGFGIARELCFYYRL